VLFIDIVSYSKLVTSKATFECPIKLSASRTFQISRGKAPLLTVPTGDGMALVFYNTPEAPVECALRSAAPRTHQLQLRMGIHSGPVSGRLT
jgi:class 3 adenylate cyclase